MPEKSLSNRFSSSSNQTTYFLNTTQKIKGMMKRLGAIFQYRTKDHQPEEVEVQRANKSNLLKRMQPNPYLKKLSLSRYGDSSFPSWMMLDMDLSLPNIVEISMTKCHKCFRLPPFWQLPSLQVLRLSEMESLQYVYDDEDYEPPVSGRGFFPSLKYLHLSRMKSLKGLGLNMWELVPLERSTQNNRWRRMEHFVVLTVLETLYIDDCPNLNLSFTSSSGDYNDDENGVQFQSLWSLSTLIITNMPNLVSLPGLQYLTTLQCLWISLCPNLVTLPESFGKLTSLEELVIIQCSSLKSLPDSIRCLSRLQVLRVICCRCLSKRCQKGIGDDWSKIAHVSRIEVQESPKRLDYFRFWLPCLDP